MFLAGFHFVSRSARGVRVVKPLAERGRLLGSIGLLLGVLAMSPASG